MLNKKELILLHSKLNLSLGQIRSLIDFLESIKSLEPTIFYKTFVKQIAKTFKSKSVILFFIDRLKTEALVRPIEFFGFEINKEEIKNIYFNEEKIDTLSELRGIHYGNLKIECKNISSNDIVDHFTIFSVIYQNKCIGLIAFKKDYNLILDKEKEKIEELIKVISPTAGSLLKNIFEVKKKTDKIEKEKEELEKKIQKIKNTQSYIALIFIFIAFGLSFSAMLLVKNFGISAEITDGVSLLYGMTGFTTFFIVIFIVFKFISDPEQLANLFNSIFKKSS
ncbi:MAG: hypothetical protein ACFFE4_11900 [Candidatus Thorarchaeota archaeon]